MTKQIIKYSAIVSFLGLLISCSSTKDFSNYDSTRGALIETGEASWYGPNFHGKQTANGETFDQYDLTAAHRTLAFNSIIRVINKSNNKSVVVRINDRGPYAKNRIIDLSRKAAKEIDMIHTGFGDVDLYLLNNTSLPKNLERAHYTVQIGSYKRLADAENFSRRIPNSRIVKSIIDKELFYRMYVGEFKNKNEAIQQKLSLENKGIKGFVKQIEN